MVEKKKILFIDDNPVDRAFIQGILEKQNFQVLLAESSQDGLRLAREQKPDLILLDILLPGISGIEVCKILKNDPATKTIPLFFYTSIATPKELIDYKSYGAQNYLQKNMPSGELIFEIKSVMKY